MSSLIFLLPDANVTAATELAYLVSVDGRSVGVHASAPPALLPRPAGAGSEVVAVVPISALSWHQVELPRGVINPTPETTISFIKAASIQKRTLARLPI